MSAVTRRHFLASAAVVSALPLASRPCLARLVAAAPEESASISPDCLLVDTGEHCAIPESLAGFARGLEAASIPYRSAKATAIAPADFIIVPGAALHSNEFARSLRHLAELGSTVVYESGGAYADPEALRIEQKLVGSYLALAVKPPVNLWTELGSTPSACPPYVHYHWPMKASVRDFSRAIPSEVVEASYGRTIAEVGGLPVCCRMRLGKGELIFLGSPLGPHLGSVDREAQTLLEAFMAPF